MHLLHDVCASLMHSEKIDGRCAIMPGDAIINLIAGSTFEAERGRKWIGVDCNEGNAMHLTKRLYCDRA